MNLDQSISLHGSNTIKRVETFNISQKSPSHSQLDLQNGKPLIN